MLFASCTVIEKKEPAESLGKAIVSVYVDDEERYILEDEAVEITEGDTAFDVLQKAVQENKIHMEFEGNGKDAYVVGIDNLYTFDKGENSGWLFYLNGESSTVGAGNLEVSDGDMVEWRFVADWTKAE